MDIVLVGLPGSGKSVVGRRLPSRHGGDVHRSRRADRIARRPDDPGDLRRRRRGRLPAPRTSRRDRPGAGRSRPGDPPHRGDRRRGRSSIHATAGRSTAAGRSIWLDGRPEVLAQRLRRSPRVRPLVESRDPIGAHPRPRRETGSLLRRGRHPGHGRRRDPGRHPGGRGPARRGPGRSRHDPAARRHGDRTGRARRRASPRPRSASALTELKARRAILVSEPGAWDACRARHRDGAARRRLDGRDDPAARRARTPSACRWSRAPRATSSACGSSASEPLVAIGGGALGDAAGFLAATYLRGIPLIHVPTTLVAQIDSSIGGKTGVDLPEGKNLVGAFHLPVATIIDVAALTTLPERQRRAALGEAVKMAALGDERLFALLEARRRWRRHGGRGLRRPAPSRRSSNAVPGPRWRSSSPMSASATRRAAGSP